MNSLKFKVIIRNQMFNKDYHFIDIFYRYLILNYQHNIIMNEGIRTLFCTTHDKYLIDMILIKSLYNREYFNVINSFIVFDAIDPKDTTYNDKFFIDVNEDKDDLDNDDNNLQKFIDFMNAVGELNNINSPAQLKLKELKDERHTQFVDYIICSIKYEMEQELEYMIREGNFKKIIDARRCLETYTNDFLRHTINKTSDVINELIDDKIKKLTIENRNKNKKKL